MACHQKANQPDDSQALDSFGAIQPSVQAARKSARRTLATPIV